MVDDKYFGGIYSEFRGFITFEITEEEIPMNFTSALAGDYGVAYPLRYRIKVPQNSPIGLPQSRMHSQGSKLWRETDMTFEGGGIYTVAKFNGIVFNNKDRSDPQLSNSYEEHDKINSMSINDGFQVTGVIRTNYNDTDTEMDMVSNSDSGGFGYFGGNWLNFALYLPQIGFLPNSGGFDNGTWDMRATTSLTPITNGSYYCKDNDELIAGNETNTKGFARSDLHFTAFVKVPPTDIIKFNRMSEKGISINDLISNGMTGKYLNGETEGYEYSGNGGKIKLLDGNAVDPNYYFL